MRYQRMIRVGTVAMLLMLLGVAVMASSDNFPSQEEIATAHETSDLLHNELFAALLKEFDETTPANAEQGKHAISLVFNNSNRDIRLIGAVAPLLGGMNNLPSDSFEGKSLLLALQGLGNTTTERVGNRWYYRRSDPLSNTFHPNCVTYHASFANLQNNGQWVGALVTRVPIDPN